MMGSTASEDGVLKLVLPGRYVEVYRQPVGAAEILKKYPRHSVTRPDVFEYPWVVVKPESVLKLGKVFFVVPNHTLYNLMKSHREKNLKPDNKQVQNQDSPIKSQAGSTPKHRNCHTKLYQSPPTTSCSWIPSLDHDRDSRTRRQNKVGSWPDVVLKNKTPLLRLLEDKPVKNSRIMTRSSNHEEDHNIDKNITLEFHKKRYGNLEFRDKQEVTMLKSCLRKPDSARKSIQLKVSFFLPAKHEEHLRRVRVSP